MPARLNLLSQQRYRTYTGQRPTKTSPALSLSRQPHLKSCTNQPTMIEDDAGQIAWDGWLELEAFFDN
jgi:hypothetical protein